MSRSLLSKAYPTIEGKGRIIGVDVDEVCADLLGVWLKRYNKEYGDCLLPENITGWDLNQFVKPQAQHNVYRILDAPDLYWDILPIHGARGAVDWMREMGFRVVFVTACHKGTAEAKRDWLLKWDFFRPKQADVDFAPVTDKSLIRADVLFDDREKNVKEFKGTGVLVRRAHNVGSAYPHQIGALEDAPFWLANREWAGRRVEACL